MNKILTFCTCAGRSLHTATHEPGSAASNTVALRLSRADGSRLDDSATPQRQPESPALNDRGGKVEAQSVVPPHTVFTAECGTYFR